MRALSLLCACALAAALAAPARAEPARTEASGEYLLLAEKEDRERGRNEGRRERDHDAGRGNRHRDAERWEGRHERSRDANRSGRWEERRDDDRRISPGEAAARAQRSHPGRVLGVQFLSPPGAPPEYAVKILDNGRLRVIRIPAED